MRARLVVVVVKIEPGVLDEARLAEPLVGLLRTRPSNFGEIVGDRPREVETLPLKVDAGEKTRDFTVFGLIRSNEDNGYW
jgi:hypothetical protein